ncbi:MAG: hypothetical protein H6747_07390 [Deltaproteobacteria bacterium]|nr:hypothetical protein [Deltaproteobacteria bacterium]
MRNAMTGRLSLRHVAMCPIFGAAALCLLVGCGSGDDEAKDSLTLPTTDADDGSGWVFGGDAAVSDSGTDAVGSSDADAAGSSETSTADGGGGDGDTTTGTDSADVAGTDDAGGGAVDAGPTPVTSCAGSCGLYLEGNPCHCNHACAAAGDCCGGQGAYLAACACNVDGDCDDANPCTLDTCQDKGGSKLCMNLPFEGCCSTDAQCSGGDGVCNLAACVDGSCTLLPKGCDDGVDCTVDTCDPANGACQHTLPKTSCVIDGACWKAGDAKPGSGGCQRCEPAVDPKVWTAKPGTCLIDGSCVDSGASESGNLCHVCVPDKAKDAWSVATGQCFIDGACYPDGASKLGSSCAVCDSKQTQTDWSGKAGTCAIGGTCYSAGEGPAGASCASCDPSKSTAAFTVSGGGCFIDGACHAGKAAKPGSGGCEICDASKSTAAWTPQLGLPCDDGDGCTANDACTSALVCKGKPTGGTCCKSDEECALQVNPGACEKAVCKGDGSCAIVPKSNCCSAGVCCDTENGVFEEKGTLCDLDPKKVEYKCEGGDGYARNYGPGCTGDNANKCSSAVVGYTEWTVVKACGAGTACSISPPSPPVCKSNP